MRRTDIIQLDVIFRKETSMTDHDLLIDDMSKRQVAEKLREQLVSIHIVFGFDFAFKAVHFV